MRRHLEYEKRKYTFGLIAIIIVLIYIIRLFNLQILSDEYKRYADSNAFFKCTIYPSRGSIYDRTGKLIVFNQPAYDITFIPRKVKKLDTLNLCSLLDLSLTDFNERMSDIKNKRLNPAYSRYTPQKFMSQLMPTEIGLFQEKLFQFSGFKIERKFIRKYNYNAAAHLLGSIAEVSPRDLKKDKYYRRGELIGKEGIERKYEKELRGEKGAEVLLRDAHGRIKGSYKKGIYDVPPIHGKDLTLGLDIDLQMLGERLLKHKIGSIVAIEPKTGEVLCMISSPSFDPNKMVGRNRSQNYVQLYKDRQKPLLNRSIQGTYPPGSTFKAAQGLVFLNEGIITPKTQYPCQHGFTFKSLHVGCHSHPSPLGLTSAIATSCNSYFCWGLFRMIGNEKYKSPSEALTVWKDDMVSMGFGYKLGIDLPYEQRGFIPNAKYYSHMYRGYWNGLTIISIAIGQGEILLTPLQMANLGATIANRGYFVTPHVVKKIEAASLDTLYIKRRYTHVKREYYEDIVKGMQKAVTEGTCRRGAIPGIEVCGKTGTAQNRGHDHSIFMGFAPMSNPKIAIAVYVENGGFGATYGVPIGSLMMEQYLKGKLSPESEKKANDISNRRIYYADEKR